MIVTDDDNDYYDNDCDDDYDDNDHDQVSITIGPDLDPDC